MQKETSSMRNQYLYMTQSIPAAFYTLAMVIKGVKTGSNELSKYAALLEFENGTLDWKEGWVQYH